MVATEMRAPEPAAAAGEPERSRPAWLRTAGLIGGDAARAVATAAGIAVMTFFLVRMIPGDVVDVMAIQGQLTYEQQSNLRDELGLTDSWAAQFVTWLGMLAQGDFGLSSRFGTPVIDVIASAVPATLELAAYSLAIGLVLGIGLPVMATLYPRSPWVWAVNAVTIWSIVVPTFSIGLTCVIVFAVWLGWIPAIGNMLVPAMILGTDIAGQLAKMLLEDMRESQTAYFVRTARAKGLSRLRITVMHILPNSLAVVLALFGIVIAGTLTGAITMEVVFGIHGLGTLTLGAVKGRDYPLVQAVIIWLGVAVVLANLVTDTLQRLIDPRTAAARR